MRTRHLLAPCLLALALAGCDRNKPEPTAKQSTEDEGPAVPRAVVREKDATRDAGEIDFGEPKEFPFTIHNAGKAPLHLTFVRRNCDCADVTLPGEIAPGADGKATIHWKPHPNTAPNFTLVADLETDDPQHPTLQLRVTARIHSSIRIDPDADSFIDFGDAPLAPGEVKVRELKVFSPELEKFKLEASCSHPGFEVSEPTPLPPMTRVGAYEARSGYKVEVKTTGKLPLGSVEGMLNLTVKVTEKPDRTFTMPVYAVVGNGVVAVHPRKIVFNKKHITEADSKVVRLEFINPPENETVEVVRKEPAFLEVSKPEKVRRGAWTVTVKIPENNSEAAKFQPDLFVDGQVVFKASGARAEVSVRVKWDPSER
jgi:hypothetical protein